MFVVGEELVARGRFARPDSYGDTMLMLCKKLFGVAHAYLDMCEYSFCCCLCRRGAWMFAEMLIHVRFGKFLHHPYVLVLGEVMPNFSGDHAYACVCVSFCGCVCTRMLRY